jgi:hypothetical protein
MDVDPTGIHQFFLNAKTPPPGVRRSSAARKLVHVFASALAFADQRGQFDARVRHRLTRAHIRVLACAAFVASH